MTYQPAGPTQDRVRQLLTGGATIDGLAAATGLSRGAIWQLSARPQRHVQAYTAHAIERVTFRDIIEHATTHVPATGTRRRIRALLALGWTHKHITEASGSKATNCLLYQRNPMVSVRNYRAIVTAYDALSMTPGPSAITRSRAAAKRYPTPLAWDDDTIDDPTAQPAPYGACQPGRARVSIDALIDCATWGMTREQAADRLGVTLSAIEKHIERLDGRAGSDLAARFHRNAIVQGLDKGLSTTPRRTAV